MFFFVDGRERLAYASFMATNNNTGSKQMTTRKIIEDLAIEQNVDVLSLISQLQTGAAQLDDGEQTLNELIELKSEILEERGY